MPRSEHKVFLLRRRFDKFCFLEIITVYYENHTTLIDLNTLCMQMQL